MSAVPVTKLYTLVFCRRQQPSEILLGMKKRGFGMNKWNGFGGKVEVNETIPQAAARELQEECGLDVDVAALAKRGLLRFQFTSNMNLTMEVHVFEATKWSGEPKESDEMKPQWFPLDQIPYKSMWADDEHWLPWFLDGKSFQGHFVFEDETIQSQTLEQVPGF